MVRFSTYFAALVAITYGFAKVNHAQFTMIDSELDKPMRDVSGFWLVWYFFGYSPVYGSLVAWLQILGGVMLTFRRTALPGAFLLTPVFANIVMIDIFFGVDPGSMLVALVTLLALLAIVFQQRESLFKLFWSDQESIRARAVGPWILRIGFLVFGAGFSYYAANFNNFRWMVFGKWVS